MRFEMDIITVEELAERLGKCNRTIQLWCNRGLLPQPKVFGSLKFWPTEQIKEVLGLAKCMHEGRVEAASEMAKAMSDGKHSSISVPEELKVGS